MKITVLSGLVFCVAMLARADEVTGFLADAKCAAGGKAASAAHAACAKKCVDGGSAVVLVTADNKVYQIKNPDKVKAHVGSKATLQGKVEGDAIEVERGRPAE
jgi:hypothetical protein